MPVSERLSREATVVRLPLLTFEPQRFRRSEVTASMQQLEDGLSGDSTPAADPKCLGNVNKLSQNSRIRTSHQRSQGAPGNGRKLFFTDPHGVMMFSFS
jgi:hypothetical protein